jgi:hypothetical protein
MGQSSPRFVHVFLPEDPVEAHGVIMDAAQGHLASRRYAASDYDRARLHNMINTGGFSHHPTRGTPPAKGYMVSYDLGPEKAKEVPAAEVTPDHIAAHRAAISDELAQPNSYQGGWVDRAQDKVFLDASRHFDNEDEARPFALKNRQLAYYDIGNDDDYYLNPHRDALAKSDPEAHRRKYEHIYSRYGSQPPKEYESYRHLYELPEEGHQAYRIGVRHQAARNVAYVLSVSDDDRHVATVAVRPDGSWYYRGDEPSPRIAKTVQADVNRAVGDLFSGSYSGKPAWLRGHPVGPWLSQHRDRIEDDKQRVGWR